MKFPLKDTAISDNSAKILQHSMFKAPTVWELIKGLLNPTPRPLDCLQVEVTSHCAARCIYCPHTTESEHWQGKHMQSRTFANLWPLLQKSTRVHLQGWGEPFLHPQFFDFVALARKADCLVSSTSCGLHLTENMAKQILTSGIDIIAFSLAGTDNISNAARQGADFDKVCQKILLLQNLRKKHMAVHLELHLAYILLADRMEAVLALPKLMHKLGISTSIISTLDYIPNPELQHLALTPNDTANLLKAKEILEEASSLAKEYDVHLHYALPSAVTNTSCRENIQKSLYVNAEGDISPCVYLNVPTKKQTENATALFGNVNTENSWDIWQKDTFTAFRQSHAADCPSEALCQTCVKRYEVLL